MEVDEEIEIIETAIADIRSAISELTISGYVHFESNIASLEDEIRDLNARLEELEAIQNAEWQKEMDWQNREYERSVI